jgi:cytidyltransferase-like protein|tara:strand:+ start:350 stop:805 length:456 start_codon:yes stop_codon:yes gene_type:complete
MTVIVLSGYFNPIHPGHISMILEAKEYAEKLIVIVNSDEQVKRKGSLPFLDEWARCEIVRNIKGVDETLLAIDDDGTVVKSLERIKLDHRDHKIFFGNGGDRSPHSSAIPEVKFCEANGIVLIYGVGDEKRYSSSCLIKKASLCYRDYINE